MTGSVRDRTLALAGVFQAAALVRQVARTGEVDRADAETCLESLFVENPQTTEDVFGGVVPVRRGLQVLVEQLGGDARGRDLELARYVISLLVLERKLARSPALLDQIDRGLARIRDQRRHFALMHPTIIGALGQLYADTVSTLLPRIMVTGEARFLEDDDNAALIRALLLGGIRAAVLYRQVGGRRWQIVLQRGRIEAAARALLEEPATPTLH